MTLPELLHHLDSLGVSLEAKGEHLSCRPSTRVTPELAELLKAHKPALLAMLHNASQEPLEAAWLATVDKLANDPDFPPDTLEAMRAAQVEPGEPCQLTVIPLPDPCPRCRSLELWRGLDGIWKCQHCEPSEVDFEEVNQWQE